ncbi:MAG: hypothetical protein ACLFRV_03930 [Acidimicrobiales bacterium]
MVIHWNGPPAKVVGHRNGHRRCLAYWRALDRFHARKFPGGQIPGTLYSFGACPHGGLLVAQGWDLPQGANGTPDKDPALGGDDEWYTIIGLIGQGESPTPAMIARIRDTIHVGRTTGRCGLEVRPHSDFKHKTCPGPELTALAREWHNTRFDVEDDTMMQFVGIDSQGRTWRFVAGWAIGPLSTAEARYVRNEGAIEWPEGAETDRALAVSAVAPAGVR